MPDPTPCPHYGDCQAPDLAEQLSEVLTELKTLHSAFPVGAEGTTDLTGHRHFHEAKIKAAVAEEAFWNELKLDLAKKGAWGIILVIVGLIITGAAVKIGIHK